MNICNFSNPCKNRKVETIWGKMGKRDPSKGEIWGVGWGGNHPKKERISAELENTENRSIRWGRTVATAEHKERGLEVYRNKRGSLKNALLCGEWGTT